MKIRATNILLGLLSLLLFTSPGASSDRNAASACGTIQITAPGAPAPPKRKPTKKPTFSASSILDLKLEVALSPALKGPHQLEFHLYTPNGHLYQAVPANVTAPPAGNDRRQREIAKRTASATVPVAGTTIVNSSLYGEWKVEAFLDGERTAACTKPLWFDIEP